MLVQVKQEGAVSLSWLLRLVLKSIYEPKNMSLQDEKIMQHSLVSWSRHACPTEEEKVIVERLGWLINKNQEGGFEDRKRMFKEHNIDYKKFHRLPENMGMTNDRRREIQKIKKAQRRRWNTA